ncbi:hypothetical protein ACFPK9_09885 [Rubritalea spongiae]|uniref:Uncharacterized protein n=1 Tax=Rubritalea spongiae TaxID=430797 RepID=A0ABW5E128_9BACT
MKSNAPNSCSFKQLVNQFPADVAAQLFELIQSAYDRKDQFLMENRDICGPNVVYLAGNVRWHALENAVYDAVSLNKIRGSVEWRNAGNSGLKYLDYRVDGYSVTFAHASKLDQLPKHSKYRSVRAASMKEEVLFPELFPEAEVELSDGDTGLINLVMAYGEASSRFAQLILLGTQAGETVARSFGANIALFANNVDLDETADKSNEVAPIEKITLGNVELRVNDGDEEEKTS